LIGTRTPPSRRIAFLRSFILCPKKLRAIESLGVDSLLLIHFDKAFSEQTGEAFIRGLARDFGQSTISSCVSERTLFWA